jgi:hypothetical protein
MPTDLTPLERDALDNSDECDPARIMRELSDLQQWCVFMSRKDRGGMPAADLIQRTRICIVNLRKDRTRARATPLPSARRTNDPTR